MNTLDPETLDHVNGGVVASRSTSTTSITDSLNTLNTQLQNLTNNNNPNNNQNSLLLPIAMMAFMQRQRQTVISPGGTIVA
jgi:hypothetical protein